MKLIKKSIVIMCFMIAMLTCSKAEEAAKTAVTKLVTDIQSILKSGGGENEFKPILQGSFYAELISGQVLKGVQKELMNTIGREEAKEKMKQFKADFTPIFTDYMIRKYSKKDFLDKFKGMALQVGNSYSEGEYVIVNTTFKSDAGSGGDLKVTFKMRDGKVAEITFDQSIGVFAIEQSGVTGYFTGECKGDLQALAGKYQTLPAN
jgi:ABC-type transporter MlaC component